ncbi:hypothetical protein N7505_007453 [Penicillium chrysogenum]|uniref:Uncharacterized protein n=1 Tax=Penicillium chrysogenum TaxID=5076 RepID=A0ABQ8WDN7_PENCH|nr:hypothetical protein N7505_007453 [Penicillium chrysogenum]
MTVFVVSLFLPHSVAPQPETSSSSQVQLPAHARLPQTLNPPRSRRDGDYRGETALKGHPSSPDATTDNDCMLTSNLPVQVSECTHDDFLSKSHQKNWLPTEGEHRWSVIPAKRGNDGLADAIRSATDMGHLNDPIWVGTLGVQTDTMEHYDRMTLERKLEDEYRSLTVFVYDRDFDGHYMHFCKTILWPIFHYQVPDSPKSKAYEDCSWAFYVRVNRAFAERVAQNWKRGDSIWVQDYHLMLVPAILRKMLPEADIGFFLHSAFPSSEVFRCLAARKELLEGMLGADLIGFQVGEYSSHFLRTCARILSVEANDAGIELEDRFVKVATCPIGIDPTCWDRRRKSADINSWIDSISTAHRGKRLIVSCDKVDAVGGICQKLLSYERFLNAYPEWANQVVLIQVVTTTTQQHKLEAGISDAAMRINSLYATLNHQPLVFLKQDLAFPQYLGLLTAADALMITSLREGMNLTSHEFIHCQDGLYGDKRYGSLILSEFTGSASLFGNHALLVNPWDIRQCANALYAALIRDCRERKRDWEKLHQLVLDNSAINWVKSFKESMAYIGDKHLPYRMMTLPHLSVARLKERYQHASRRMIFIQFEGTLSPWGSPNNVFIATPQRTVATLTDLTDDAANDVYVLSSRMPEELERHFRHVIGVGLIAENGCLLRKPHAKEWTQLVGQAYTDTWKDGVSHILAYFRERMEGSWVETRHYSLAFHYGLVADKGMAKRLAAECADQVNDTCNSQGIHAVILDGSVIVGPISIKQASAAEQVCRYAESSIKPKFDFLLTIGSNRELEHLFRWANELKNTGMVDYTMTVSTDQRSVEAKTH